MPAARTKRRLPTGTQSFRKLRERGCYYVDKTPYALRLVDAGDCYFLSRPRRFGKSLFVSTLKALFEGRRELFQGLAAHDQWDWSVRRPVLILDLANVDASLPGDLQDDVGEQLDGMECSHGVKRRYNTARGRFRHLIRTLHERSRRRVVLLVDEFDKPIIDALEQPDVESRRGALALVKKQ